MALIDLPASPGPAKQQFIPVTFEGVLTPPFGAEEQHINRLGDRWAVAVELPRLSLRAARDWSADLVSARRFGARWKLRQPGLKIGAPGAPLVAGAGQGGMMLSVDGMTPYAGWQKGQFVSIVTDGRRYLYQFAAAGAAAADGGAAFAFSTPLRVAPADNDPVEFVPQIEGRLAGDDASWTIDELRLGHAAFVIREMA